MYFVYVVLVVTLERRNKGAANVAAEPAEPCDTQADPEAAEPRIPGIEGRPQLRITMNSPPAESGGLGTVSSSRLVVFTLDDVYLAGNHSS